MICVIQTRISIFYISLKTLTHMENGEFGEFGECYRDRKMFYTERHAWFQCSLKFLSHMDILWQHYLENKKSTFFAYITKQSYAAILESSKTSNPFQNRRNYFHCILGIIQWHDFCKAVTLRKKWRKAKMEGSCYS